MGRLKRHLQPLRQSPSQQNARKPARQAQPPVTAPANARASAPTVAAATAAVVVVAAALKVARKAARTLVLKAVLKVAPRVKAATSAGNAILMDVLKANARTVPWVKAANPASCVNPVATAATRHAAMSVWTPARKLVQTANPARMPVSPVPSQAAVAVNVPKAVANVVSHALKPANREASASSVTP